MAAIVWLAGLLLYQAPADPRVLDHVRAGLTARESGRLEEAARELSEAARLAPQIAEIHLNLGLVHHRRQDWKSAIGEFEEALKLKPQLTGVRDLLGFDYLMMGNLEAAEQSLGIALNENTNNVDARYWLGLVYLEQGRFRESIERLEEARKSKAKDLDLLFYLGRAYDRAAAAVRNELFVLGPESFRARLAAAEYAAFNGNTEKALEEYGKAAKLEPRMPGVHSAIAEIYAARGDYKQAEGFYRTELGLAGQNARVNYRYGVILDQLGRTAEALPYLERAVGADPSLLDAHLELAKQYIQSGKLDSAAKSLEKILAADPPVELKRSAHYQMALLERKRGRPAESARHLRAFEELKASPGPP